MTSRRKRASHLEQPRWKEDCAYNASLDSLSQELVDNVVEVLRIAGEKIVHYATVSQLFQHAVERHTFRQLRLKKWTIRKMPAMPLSRQSAIRDITYTIYCPSLTNIKNLAFLGNRDANDISNLVLHNELSYVLQFLKSIDVSTGAPIKLKICIQSLEKKTHARRERFWKDLGRKSASKQTADGSCLWLPIVQRLPVLARRYQKLNLTSFGSYRGDKLLKIISCFENLGNVYLYVPFEWGSLPCPTEQRKYCEQFARGLSTYSFPRPTELLISFWGKGTSMETFTPRNRLACSSTSIDLLSASNNHLSQQLSVLDLAFGCTVSPDLFWSEEEQKPFWPALKRMNIQFSMTTKVTRSYKGLLPFNAPDDQSIDSEDEYSSQDEDEVDFHSMGRDIPEEGSCEMLTRILIAAAHSTSQMPKLESMAIKVHLGHNVPEPYYITFVDKHVDFDSAKCSCSACLARILIDDHHMKGCPSVHWTFDNDFDPSKIEDLWIQVKGQYGLEIVGKSYNRKISVSKQVIRRIYRGDILLNLAPWT